MTDLGGTGLRGKVCVVTGGGSGIGRATVVALARAGARVAVLDREEERAQAVAAGVAVMDGEACAWVCDVSNPHEVEVARGEIESRWGAADILVNNAGMLRPGSLADLSVADWNAVLAVNLTGCFICAQAFGPGMRARGSGAIVNVSSIGADHSTPNLGAYSVSKAGVSMLSRLLAAEWGPFGVRSNAVLPGLIRTPLSEAAYQHPEAVDKRSQAVALRRIGTPEDVAETIVYLAGESSAYVNGAELLVDGGFGRNLMSLVPRF